MHLGIIPFLDALTYFTPSDDFLWFLASYLIIFKVFLA